jgi:hypothetical protein
MAETAEERRLAAHQAGWADWKKWGPYLSERAWGTVREDYSADGSAWEYLLHEHARTRTYRWNEDGLAGISDSRQQLCFALALWNGHDEFFCDVLHCGRGETRQIPLRSMVGLIPLFAVTTIEPAVLNALPEFKRHMEWFLEHRPHLARLVSRWQAPGLGERRLLAILRGHRMKRVLRRTTSRSASCESFWPMRMPAGPSSASKRHFDTTHTGAIISCFTNISPGTTGAALAPVTRRVGPRWWRS